MDLIAADSHLLAGSDLDLCGLVQERVRLLLVTVLVLDLREPLR